MKDFKRIYESEIKNIKSYDVKCKKCGATMLTQGYYYPEGYYILLFCSKCDYVMPYSYEGKVPREIGERYFPGCEVL